MFALIKRNTKIYFANKPGVIMSCFGALISFVIYIGFLQQNLVNSWQHVSHAKQLLDLWDARRNCINCRNYYIFSSTGSNG